MQTGQTSVAGTSQAAHFQTGGSLRAKSLAADRPIAPVRTLITRRVSVVVEPKSYSYDRRCRGEVRICETLVLMLRSFRVGPNSLSTETEYLRPPVSNTLMWPQHSSQTRRRRSSRRRIGDSPFTSTSSQNIGAPFASTWSWKRSDGGLFGRSCLGAHRARCVFIAAFDVRSAQSSQTPNTVAITRNPIPVGQGCAT